MSSIVSKLDSQKDQPRDFTRRVQVIGCGLGRTGTNSFSAALERLLDGPVYHSGTAVLGGDEDTILTWTAMMQPHADAAFVEASLGRMLAGYVGVTDTPIALFTPELCQLYPDATVICTTRNVDAWWRSWEAIAAKMSPRLMNLLLWPVPTWRYLAGFLGALESKQRRNYPLDPNVSPPGKELYHCHMDFVQRVVPRERLYFFDVKEGWGPLCEILRVPVPDEPFPRGNDAKAMEELSRVVLKNAAMKWAKILGAGVSVGVVGLYYYLW